MSLVVKCVWGEIGRGSSNDDGAITKVNLGYMLCADDDVHPLSGEGFIFERETRWRG